MQLNDIIGKKITAARYDGESIYLHADNAWIKLTPWGDCCSSCYVQHVSGTDAMKGATVAAVEQIESEPTEEERKGADVLDGWGHRITTDKGICAIEMRLAHNGYYGGHLEVSEMAPTDAAKPLDDF